MKVKKSSDLLCVRNKKELGESGATVLPFALLFLCKSDDIFYKICRRVCRLSLAIDNCYSEIFAHVAELEYRLGNRFTRCCEDTARLSALGREVYFARR